MNTTRIELWWTAAGCLPDAEHPAYIADNMTDAQTWLAGDEAAEYYATTGEHNTYTFELVEVNYTSCPTCENDYAENTGEPIPHDVMGDPRPTITVCPECATISHRYNTNH
jgi:hypothetical protein